MRAHVSLGASSTTPEYSLDFMRIKDSLLAVLGFVSPRNGENPGKTAEKRPNTYRLCSNEKLNSHEVYWATCPYAHDADQPTSGFGRKTKQASRSGFAPHDAQQAIEAETNHPEVPD